MASFLGNTMDEPIGLDNDQYWKSHAIDLTGDEEAASKPPTPMLPRPNIHDGANMTVGQSIRQAPLKDSSEGSATAPFLSTQPNVSGAPITHSTRLEVEKIEPIKEISAATAATVDDQRASERPLPTTSPPAKTYNDDNAIQALMDVRNLIVQEQPIRKLAESDREQATLNSRLQQSTTNKGIGNNSEPIRQRDASLMTGTPDMVSSTNKGFNLSTPPPSGKVKAIKSAPVAINTSRRSRKVGPSNLRIRYTPDSLLDMTDQSSRATRSEKEPTKPTEAPRNFSIDQAPTETRKENSPAHVAFPKLPRFSDVVGFDAARLVVEECLSKHLNNFYVSQARSVRNQLRKQRTCQGREMRLSQRLGTQSRRFPTLPVKYIQNTSPFENIQADKVSSSAKTPKEKVRQLSQEIFNKAKPREFVFRKSCRVLPTHYKSVTVHIPKFKEYASLKENILSENESKLLTWPYFEDEDETSRAKLYHQLPLAYEMINEGSPLRNLRNEQCRVYGPLVEDLLKELGLSWESIIFVILAPAEDIQRINNVSPAGREQFNALISNWISDRAKDFDPANKTWQSLIAKLQVPSPKEVRISVLVCSAFFRESGGFSIFHLAKQSSIIQEYALLKTGSSTGESGPKSQSGHNFTYRGIMCRICHEHNCIFHGELRQYPDDETVQDHPNAISWNRDDSEGSDTNHEDANSKDTSSDSESDLDRPSIRPVHEDGDPIIERVINYKRAVNRFAIPACSGADKLNRKSVKPPSGKFNVSWWHHHTHTANWENRRPFYPCHHEGSCETAQCRCFREGITCEKTCACPKACNRRFPGCICVQTPSRRLCGTEKCACYRLNRECDGDLCGTCGASEMLDPVNRYKQDIGKDKCCNVAVQRGLPKKTLLGHSEVHGFGLYTGEDVKKDEFIGEYKGEVITDAEGDRRVIIYDYQQTMYLFRLNLEQEVDATHAGNKTRFINNADKKYTNCYPKNLLCDTVFRLAMFARIDLKAGTELFFDYNYPKEKTVNFKQPKSKTIGSSKIVAVKETTKKAKPSSSSSSRKTLQSSSSILSQIVSQPGQPKKRNVQRASTPERRRRTEKARAALAAKFAAKLAENGGEKPAAGKQSSRKPASKETTKKRRRQPSSKVAHEGNTDENDSRDQYASISITHSHQSHNTQGTQEVQDTDAEDAAILEGDAGHGASASASNPNDKGGNANHDTSDDDSEPIAEKLKGQTIHAVPPRGRGGWRPGAGRKRKRPLKNDPGNFL